MPLYPGAHTIDNGGIHMAALRAAAAGMRALQIFSAGPKFYNEKVSVRPERAAVDDRTRVDGADLAPRLGGGGCDAGTNAYRRPGAAVPRRRDGYGAAAPGRAGSHE